MTLDDVPTAPPEGSAGRSALRSRPCQVKGNERLGNEAQDHTIFLANRVVGPPGVHTIAASELFQPYVPVLVPERCDASCQDRLVRVPVRGDAYPAADPAAMSAPVLRTRSRVVKNSAPSSHTYQTGPKALHQGRSLRNARSEERQGTRRVRVVTSACGHSMACAGVASCEP